MLSLHKKTRIALSAVVATLCIIPAMAFAINKVSNFNSANAAGDVTADWEGENSHVWGSSNNLYIKVHGAVYGGVNNMKIERTWTKPDGTVVNDEYTFSNTCYSNSQYDAEEETFTITINAGQTSSDGTGTCLNSLGEAGTYTLVTWFSDGPDSTFAEIRKSFTVSINAYIQWLSGYTYQKGSNGKLSFTVHGFPLGRLGCRSDSLTVICDITVGGYGLRYGDQWTATLNGADLTSNYLESLDPGTYDMTVHISGSGEDPSYPHDTATGRFIVEAPPAQDPTISWIDGISAYNKSDSNRTPLKLQVENIPTGESIKSITVDGATIRLTNDYTVSDETVTLKTSYLDSVTSTSHNITVNLSNGKSATSNFTVSGQVTPPAQDPTISWVGNKSTYTKESGSTLQLKVNNMPDGASISSIAVGGATIQLTDDYTVNGDTATIKSAYLDTLDSKTYNIVVTLSDNKTASSRFTVEDAEGGSEEEDPTITWNSDSTHTRGDGQNLDFTINNAPAGGADIESVKLGDLTLAKNTCWYIRDSQEGTMRIEIPAECAEQLENGDYKLVVTWDDGTKAEADFTLTGDEDTSGPRVEWISGQEQKDGEDLEDLVFDIIDYPETTIDHVMIDETELVINECYTVRDATDDQPIRVTILAECLEELEDGVHTISASKDGEDPVVAFFELGVKDDDGDGDDEGVVVPDTGRMTRPGEGGNLAMMIAMPAIMITIVLGAYIRNTCKHHVKFD